MLIFFFQFIKVPYAATRPKTRLRHVYVRFTLPLRHLNVTFTLRKCDVKNEI